MRLRHDAMAAAAEWITEVESLALATEGLVATVGKVDVEPNAANVVPGKAPVSLDVRHAHDASRTHAVEKLSRRQMQLPSAAVLPCNAQTDWTSPPFPWTSG